MKPFEGVRYNIFQDPVTMDNFEGIATVKHVISEQDKFLCRCDVVFDGESKSYEMLVDYREIV